MAQGTGCFGKVLILYLVLGIASVVARVTLQRHKQHSMKERLLTTSPSVNYDSAPTGIIRRFWNTPFLPTISFLLIGAILLPQQPWRHMTSTLLYDVISTTSSVIITRTFRNQGGMSEHSSIGKNPFRTLNYSPADDPYYISNLDSPIDPFIIDALEGTQFTNIVHIVLESMRSDSYPCNENSARMKYINEKFERVDGVPELTTSNIMLFISSLFEHSISGEAGTQFGQQFRIPTRR